MSNIFFEDDILFDSHCHLGAEQIDVDRDSVVERAQENGVERIICVATDIAGVHKAVELSRQYEEIVFAAVGIDPDIFIPGSSTYDPKVTEDQILEYIKEIRQVVADNLDVVATIGETGVDDYHLAEKEKSGEVTAEEREQIVVKQMAMFTMHLELASEFDLPLTVHTRRAEETCLEMIKSFGKEVTPVFHSYTGSYETAKELIDLGGAVGMNAIATYRNAEDVRAVYKKLLGNPSNDWSPEDYYKRGVYFETDGPYLPPVSKRGSVNEPGNIPEIISDFVRQV